MLNENVILAQNAMIKKTTAAILYETNSDLVIENLNLGAPGPKEVLVQMGAAGVCHSDVHVISGQAQQLMPCVLGHEGAGIVEAIGDQVSRVSVGDHVILSWLPYCENCYQCIRGKTHLCKAFQTPVSNGTLLDGSCRFSNKQGPIRQLGSLGCWSENVVVSEECCVTINRSIPFEIAALLGCAVTTGVGAVLNRAKVQKGETVVVIGAGGVGLSVVMAAKLQGASQIICIDRNRSMRNLAIELGATDFLVASQDDDISKKLIELTDVGADHVFEAVGKRELQSAAINYCCSGGTVTFVGLDSEDATINLETTAITRAEKTISGSIYGSACTHRDFASYGEKFLKGELPIDLMVNRRYQLNEINIAINDMLEGKPGRGVIVFDH